MSEQPASAEDLVDKESPSAPYVDEPNGSTEEEEEGED